MISMRTVAVLVIAAGAAVAIAPGAGAATYCAGSTTSSAFGQCDATATGIEAALEAATANPGPDTVLIPAGVYSFESGLQYSDAGQPANGVAIRGAPACERYGCGRVELRGGSPGGALLSFGGGGGASVEVAGLILVPAPGATGAVLPPGARAGLTVSGPPDATGVRIEGTEARPVRLGGSISGTGVAVDAPGHGLLEGLHVIAGVGARVGPDGALEIRGGQIEAPVGVTGGDATISSTLMRLTATAGGDPPVGLTAECAHASSPDVQLLATNVTLIGDAIAGSTAARAQARGGDGQSCDATVRINSTALDAVETSLDARGDPGTGADPRDGVARIHVAYSAFDPARTASSGPSELETASPGGNLYGDLRFYQDILWFPYLYWDSPLIDRGDPAPPAPSPYRPVINGRRDIGRYEYRFEPPFAGIDVSPARRVAPGTVVRLTARAHDNDPGDPVSLRWTLSGGGSSRDPQLVRVYERPGRYEERLTVTDPVGLTTPETATITVVRQRLMALTIDPRTFTPSRRRAAGRRGATIGYAPAVRGPVRMHVERARPARRGRPAHWRRLPGTIRRFAEAGHSALTWRGWIGGRRLRPGRYRLVGVASPGPPRRARFRILR